MSGRLHSRPFNKPRCASTTAAGAAVHKNTDCRQVSIAHPRRRRRLSLSSSRVLCAARRQSTGTMVIIAARRERASSTDAHIVLFFFRRRLRSCARPTAAAAAATAAAAAASHPPSTHPLTYSLAQSLVASIDTPRAALEPHPRSTPRHLQLSTCVSSTFTLPLFIIINFHPPQSSSCRPLRSASSAHARTMINLPKPSPQRPTALELRPSLPTLQMPTTIGSHSAASLHAFTTVASTSTNPIAPRIEQPPQSRTPPPAPFAFKLTPAGAALGDLHSSNDSTPRAAPPLLHLKVGHDADC